jgi:membrane-associated phospholipid phosphatase
MEEYMPEKESHTLPVLRARPGGLAERFAGLLGGSHPAATFFAALLAGYVVLAGLAILLGLVVTEVLVQSLGLGSFDQGTVEEIVAERTPFLTDVASVGAFTGGAPLLPILVGLIGLVAAFKRKWLIAGFAVFVLCVESATYRVASMVVPRERPDVKRLEDLPVDASFPSGHTAASLAVYAGLVLLVTARVKDARARIALWGLAALLPVFVAFSRMYQGMHHPLDVIAGALVGVGAIAVLLFACRSAEAAVRAPARARGRSAASGGFQAAR